MVRLELRSEDDRAGVYLSKPEPFLHSSTADTPRSFVFRFRRFEIDLFAFLRSNSRPPVYLQGKGLTPFFSASGARYVPLARWDLDSLQRGQIRVESLLVMWIT
jgi:hypothetical protein